MADLWYYTSQGRQMEPVTTAELQRLAADGSLKPTDMVWREGMPRWVRASSAAEIFPDGLPAAAVARAAADAAPAPRHADRDDDRPRSRRRREENDDFDDRPARRRPAKKAGASVGVLIALVVGGGLLFVLFIVGVAIVMVTSRGPNRVAFRNQAVQPGPTNAAPVNYTVNLQQDQEDSRLFTLRRNVRYEFVVRSDHGSDVDLRVFDANREMAQDINPTEHSRLLWTPPATRPYRVVLENLGPGFNRSHVTIREFESAPGNNAPPPPPPGVRAGHGVVRVDDLLPGKDHAFKLQLPAGQEANIQVIVHQPRGGASLRLELLRDEGGQVVAATDQQGRNSLQLRHTPGAAGVYRVRLHNAGNQLARVTVTH